MLDITTYALICTTFLCQFMKLLYSDAFTHGHTGHVPRATRIHEIRGPELIFEKHIKHYSLQSFELSCSLFRQDSLCRWQVARIIS